MTNLDKKKCDDKVLSSVEAPWGYKLFLNRRGTAQVAYPVTFDEWWDIYQHNRQFPDIYSLPYYKIL